MPTEASQTRELTDEDMALLKQGVGDKTSRPQNSAQGAGEAGGEETQPDEQTGSIMTYFEDKGFGFLRPDGGGKDIFFHISRLHQGDATELVAGTKVAYDLGMDRNGKIAASSVRVLPPAAAEPPAAS